MDRMKVASELVKAARELICTRRVVEDLSDTISLPNSIRGKAQRAVRKVLKPIYFDAIPLEEIFDALKRHGVTVIQEDGTSWSGILSGRDSSAYFDLAYDGRYVKNAMLALSWYRMPSGRYEVTGYIT